MVAAYTFTLAGVFGILCLGCISGLLLLRSGWMLRQRNAELSILLIVTLGNSCINGLMGMDPELGSQLNCLGYVIHTMISLAGVLVVVFIKTLLAYLKFGCNDRIEKPADGASIYDSLYYRRMKQLSLFTKGGKYKLLFPISIWYLVLLLPTIIYTSIRGMIMSELVVDATCPIDILINLTLPGIAFMVLNFLVIVYSLRGRVDKIYLHHELKWLFTTVLVWACFAGFYNINEVKAWLGILGGQMVVYFIPSMFLLYFGGLDIIIKAHKHQAGLERNRATIVSVSSVSHVKSREELKSILSTPEMFEELKKFTLAEFSAENCMFYKLVEEYRQTPSTEAALKLFDDYINESGDLCVNISYPARIALKKLIVADEITETMFDKAQEEVFGLLLTDTFPRYQNHHRTVSP